MNTSRDSYDQYDLYQLVLEGTETKYEHVGPVDYTYYTVSVIDIRRFADNLRLNDFEVQADALDIRWEGDELLEVPDHLAGEYVVVTRPHDGAFITILPEEEK